MAEDFKYVTVGESIFEDVKGLAVGELEDMADEIDAAAEQVATAFAEAKEAVRADLQRRADEALAALRRTAGEKTADGTAPKKRGRKSKDEKAAEEAAKAEAAAKTVVVDPASPNGRAISVGEMVGDA